MSLAMKKTDKLGLFLTLYDMYLRGALAYEDMWTMLDSIGYGKRHD
jgi:hypothetical protein